MDNYPAASSKGFDIYPLVYKFDAPRAWHEPRPDRTYSASVVICREGEQPGADNGRVFHVPEAQWSDLGAAKRAAIEHGAHIIDGLVPGEPLAGL